MGEECKVIGHTARNEGQYRGLSFALELDSADCCHVFPLGWLSFAFHAHLGKEQTWPVSEIGRGAREKRPANTTLTSSLYTSMCRAFESTHTTPIPPDSTRISTKQGSNESAASHSVWPSNTQLVAFSSSPVRLSGPVVSQVNDRVAMRLKIYF